MTRSASTPRLRATLFVYIALIVASALVGPRAIDPAIDAAARSIGLLLVALAVLGRIWCSVFIAGRKDSELVTSGPYGMCRHPLYSLSFVGAMGLAVTSRSWVLATLTVIAIALLLRRAAVAEERNLAALFPSAWPSFVSNTPRWWPRWDRYVRAEARTVDLPVLWKAFVDGGSFVLLYVLVDLAASFRIANLTPLLWAVP
jgi:protein-S-isoprenylcysteine O-methyltransferase Ste14